MKRKTPGHLRIFVASPGDVSEERDVVSHVVPEIRRMLAEIIPVELEVVRWETHAWPDVGDDAQAVINREIGEFDVFVGIMWKRFGTPTKRARSGTDEEFQRAFGYFRKYGRPKIMFYFRNAEFYTTDLSELSQFRKVVAFQKELEESGVLYWVYKTPLHFERNVREHLVRQVLSLGGPTSGPVPRPGGKAPKRAPKPPTPPMPTASGSPDVFLAYSHADRQAVMPIYEALRIAGIRPWIDVQNMVPGQMWEAEITKAVNASRVVVIFFSQNSASKTGFLKKELDLAMSVASTNPDCLILPVRLDRVQPPPHLGMFQWVDCFEQDGMERLLAAIVSWKNRKKAAEQRRRG